MEMEGTYNTVEDALPEYRRICQILAVEGYGVLLYGTLTDFIAPGVLKPTCTCWKETYLNNVYDQSGNILFRGQDIEEPTSGIKEIGNDEKDTAIYDLFGRKVSNPLPGSIYIRDGKKFVGK